MNDFVVTLTDVPRSMADQVRPLLPAVTQAGYLRFLDMMFHYTRSSGERLRQAATVARDSELADFYTALAREEKPHYLLAASDLRSFGREPSATAPAPVRGFEAFWASPVDQRDAVLLGALCALEGVAGFIADDARLALGRLGLGAENARFVLVHLTADDAHGAGCFEHAARLGGGSGAALLAGARGAAEHWVAMHRCLSD
jgi:hypothetical protein